MRFDIAQCDDTSDVTAETVGNGSFGWYEEREMKDLLDLAVVDVESISVRAAAAPATKRN